MAFARRLGGFDGAKVLALCVVDDEAVRSRIIDPFAAWKLATVADPLDDSSTFQVVQDLEGLRSRVSRLLRYFVDRYRIFGRSKRLPVDQEQHRSEQVSHGSLEAESIDPFARVEELRLGRLACLIRSCMIHEFTSRSAQGLQTNWALCFCTPGVVAAQAESAWSLTVNERYDSSHSLLTVSNEPHARRRCASNGVCAWCLDLGEQKKEQKGSGFRITLIGFPDFGSAYKTNRSRKDP
jgi:hypothetical protein